jgi:hypothetical protein
MGRNLHVLLQSFGFGGSAVDVHKDVAVSAAHQVAALNLFDGTPFGLVERVPDRLMRQSSNLLLHGKVSTQPSDPSITRGLMVRPVRDERKISPASRSQHGRHARLATGLCIRARSYLTSIAFPPLTSRTNHADSSIIHVSP